MTGELSKKFYGAGIGPLSKILAVKRKIDVLMYTGYLFSDMFSV